MPARKSRQCSQPKPRAEQEENHGDQPRGPPATTPARSGAGLQLSHPAFHLSDTGLCVGELRPQVSNFLLWTRQQCGQYSAHVRAIRGMYQIRTMTGRPTAAIWRDCATQALHFAPGNKIRDAMPRLHSFRPNLAGADVVAHGVGMNA